MARQKYHIRQASVLKSLASEINELNCPSNRGYFTRNAKVHMKMNSNKKTGSVLRGRQKISAFFGRIGCSF